ncbi:hypothetical protein PIB30_070023 [Stylosanthes scabra]|uniref:Uncharacterized protein n=1 Tax=Stylosanthes scabra TaxID=79078 RepID=A0ABU6WN94_9FABA|nr:hypothetical protein [Stylosanthes scabra]
MGFEELGVKKLNSVPQYCVRNLCSLVEKTLGQRARFEGLHTQLCPDPKFSPSETTFLSSPNPSTHSPLSLIFIIIIVHHHHPQMASKGNGVARQPSTRIRGTFSRRQASQEAERFNTPVHAKRGEILTERKVMHERVINFHGKSDTFQEHILAQGWGFMYDPVVPINMTLVHEFYANDD